MRIAIVFFLVWTLVSCNSSNDMTGPPSTARDGCPSMDIQGRYADTVNDGQSNGIPFVWETRNWEVAPVGQKLDARVRGRINTYAVTNDGKAVPISISIQADVVNPFFVVCNFEDPLVRSQIVVLDETSIQSVSGRVGGEFWAGVRPSVVYGEYDLRVALTDGRIARSTESWQAPLM